MAEDQADQERLQSLATNLEKYEDWKAHKFPHLLDLLEEFPSVRPTAELLLCMLPLIQPRFYSISSAPEAYPGQIHLTVAVVTYRTESKSTSLSNSDQMLSDFSCANHPPLHVVNIKVLDTYKLM